jgi:hypothetical protein
VNKKNILLMISIVVLSLLSCSLSENNKDDDDEHIFFEDFESGIDDWINRSYDSISEIRLLDSGGVDNSSCVRIVNNEFNYAGLYIIVELTPSNYYNCIGWIKSEEIELAEGATDTANIDIAHIVIRSANSSIPDRLQTSGDMYRVESDWKQVAYTFFAPYGSIMLSCRLGSYDGDVKGTAYFDNIGIYELELLNYESKYFTLRIEPIDKERISDEALNDWLDKLDLVYEEYHNLVGSYPYYWEKITILSVLHNPGGWAVAGNPIKWNQKWVGEELESIENDGHWSFGIIHEIGHDYDMDARWNFDAEHMANFKLTYVVEMLNAKVPTEFGYFQGEEIYDFWEKLYEKNINDDDPANNDNVTYWFCKIVEEIGWEPFKETFRDYLDGTVTENPNSAIDRFNLFLDVLSSNTPDYDDVRDIWPEDILNMLIDYYGGSAGIVER